MQKFNVFFIVRRHWSAVTRDPHTNSHQPLPTLGYCSLPLVFGIAWVIARQRIPGLNGVLDTTAVMAAVAVLIGFMLALVTWIFQLRRDYDPSPWLTTTDSGIPELLDQSFTSASYGVLASGVTALLAIPALAGSGAVAPYFEGVLVVAILHLALTLLMLLRRMAVAYDKLAAEKDRERDVLRQKPRSKNSSN